MTRARKTEFDLSQYVRQSTSASGVPEKLEDPDAIYDAVTLLAGVRPSNATRPSSGRTARSAPSPRQSTAEARLGR